MLLHSPLLTLNHPPGQCLKLHSPPGPSAPQQTVLLLKFFGVLILSFLHRTIMECQYFRFFKGAIIRLVQVTRPLFLSGFKWFLTRGYWSWKPNTCMFHISGYCYLCRAERVAWHVFLSKYQIKCEGLFIFTMQQSIPWASKIRKRSEWMISIEKSSGNNVTFQAW